MSKKEKKENQKKESGQEEKTSQEQGGDSQKKEEAVAVTEAQIIAKLKQEYSNLWDRYLRLQAEFDNYKKRSLQEKADFVKFANDGLISELIGILDNFELSIKYADEKNDFKLMHQGVYMIIKQMHSLLSSKGLEKIKTIGEKFDPHRHEPLEIVEDSSVEREEVSEEFQPGYLLSGRILRPAKVKVVKPKVGRKDKEDKPGEEGKEEEDKQEQEKDKGDNEKKVE